MIHVRYMISFKFCYQTNISFLVPFTHFNPVQCVLGYNSLHLFLSGDDPIDSFFICSISCEKSSHSMSIRVDYVGAMRSQSSIIVLVNSVSKVPVVCMFCKDITAKTSVTYGACVMFVLALVGGSC